MNTFWNLLPTSGKLLAVAAALLVVMLYSFVAFNQTQPVTQPSLPPTLPRLNVLQRGIPDVPFSQIESQIKITGQEASSDGSIIYTVSSDNPARPDQLIIKDGKVVFERVYIPDSPSSPGYMTLDDVEKKYGSAEAVKQGSRFWGGFLKTYIYATKGYSFIANPFTKEVFEMHIFTPMSPDDYQKLWGSDITGTEHLPE